MLSTDGDAKLADFGMATTITSGVQPDVLCGAFDFLAPEMLKDYCFIPNTSIDLWALFVTFYCMSSGSYPFDSPDEVAQGVTGRLAFEYSMAMKFRRPYVHGFPVDVRELVIASLLFDVEKRPMVQDVLEHEWIRKGWPKPECGNIVKDGLFSSVQQSLFVPHPDPAPTLPVVIVLEVAPFPHLPPRFYDAVTVHVQQVTGLYLPSPPLFNAVAAQVAETKRKDRQLQRYVGKVFVDAEPARNECWISSGKSVGDNFVGEE